MSDLSGKVASGFGTGGWGTWPPPAWPPAVWPPLPSSGCNPCFAAGTKILTIRGEIAVEDIVVGDTVITVRADGPETRKVVWTGRRGIEISEHPRPEQVRPVRILAGAFESGLPERDLRLSPRHAVYVDGVLFEAQSLLNGATVIQEQSTKHVTYHHIELDQHDIMLAEGLAVESYLDAGARNMFEDQQTIVLHPTFLGIASAQFCAPLVLGGELLEAAREKLLARAEALGFAKTEPVEMIARVDGKAIWPVANGEALAFVLPDEADTVQLVSAASVPAQVVAGATDTRRLGVAVVGLTLIAGNARIGIDLADERHEGFHVMEAGGHRWTNGAASVRLPAHSGPAVLEVLTAGQVAQWAQAEAAALSA